MWCIFGTSVAKSVPCSFQRQDLVVGLMLSRPERDSSAWWVPWKFNTSIEAPVTEETKVRGDQEVTETEQKEQAQPRILDVQEDASRLVRVCLCGHGRRTTKLWIPVCP